MILGGKEIIKRVEKGDIYIDNFKPQKVNPNSYNLTLNKKILTYTGDVLDMRLPNKYTTIEIPDDGLVLKPGVLYLARTNERTITKNLVPMLEGRSSIGRLGMSIHVTAGFGDVGFDGFWTLEIYCVQPVKIYPNVEICQIYYHTIEGGYDEYESGKYQKNDDVQPSMLYKDFEDKNPEPIFEAKDLNEFKERVTYEASSISYRNINKESFSDLFRVAKENKFKYIAISIEAEGTNKPEIIINESDNYDFKLDYYMKTYNDDLVHKFSPNIRISNFACANSYDDIENALLKDCKGR